MKQRFFEPLLTLPRPDVHKLDISSGKNASYSNTGFK